MLVDYRKRTKLERFGLARNTIGVTNSYPRSSRGTVDL